MDPRFSWMVTLTGDPSRLSLEGVEFTREGISWLQEIVQSIDGLANGLGRPLSLEAGEWALYADRFESLDDSVLITRTAQTILEDAGLFNVHPTLVIRRVAESVGFGYSIWSTFDSLYIGADSPLNPDISPGGR